jgi:hypothetical protein
VAHPTPSSPFPMILHNKKRAFLLAFAETGQLRRACRAAHIDPCMHYYWMRTDELYVQAFEQADVIAAQSLEEEAIRRARDGVVRTVYRNGEVVGEERVYSDTLLIFLLKGAMPDKYGDKQELTGKGGTPLAMPVLQIVLTQEGASHP